MSWSPPSVKLIVLTQPSCQSWTASSSSLLANAPAARTVRVKRSGEKGAPLFAKTVALFVALLLPLAAPAPTSRLRKERNMAALARGANKGDSAVAAASLARLWFRLKTSSSSTNLYQRPSYGPPWLQTENEMALLQAIHTLAPQRQIAARAQKCEESLARNKLRISQPAARSVPKGRSTFM